MWITYHNSNGKFLSIHSILAVAAQASISTRGFCINQVCQADDTRVNFNVLHRD